MAYYLLIFFCASCLYLYVIWAHITKREKLEACRLKFIEDGNFNNQHQKHVGCLVQSSNVVRYSHKSPNNYNSKTLKIKRANSYLQLLKSLSDETIATTIKNPINLRDIIKGAELLFAEKIYKFQITVKIMCPKDSFIYGDPLFAELILINLLGRSIYRVPKKGKIVISIEKVTDNVKIVIHDNGYPLNEVRKKLIKQSFSLFMTDNIFQHICQENNFIYEPSKLNQGLNVTKIIIPNIHSVNSKGNVIQFVR